MNKETKSKCIDEFGNTFEDIKNMERNETKQEKLKDFRQITDDKEIQEMIDEGILKKPDKENLVDYPTKQEKWEEEPIMKFCNCGKLPHGAEMAWGCTYHHLGLKEFLQKERKERDEEEFKRRKELLEKIEDIPTKYPEFESDMYDQGNQDMKNKIKKIIKTI